MKTNRTITLLAVLSFLLVSTAPPLAGTVFGDGEERWVIEDVLGSEATPFAIGHRGYGESTAGVPDQPVENTTEAVRRGFRDGVQIVEVDTVLTRDGIPVTLHDDYLEDYTCVNTYDYQDLKGLLEDVSTLRHILQKARTFSQDLDRDRPSGQVVVEIKTPSPLCDPEDTTVSALVDAVLNEIAFTKMGDQVIVESYSPEILALVMTSEPDIPRMLAVDMLQLLSAEQVAYFTGLPVTLIEKDAGFGLQWGEIGPLYRLPSYYGPDPMGNYVSTLFGTGSHTASFDKTILLQMMAVDPANAAGLVWQLHDFGFGVHVFTVQTDFEWDAFSAFGVDGMYVDNIPWGLSKENP
jgi:glycerophosphoryl diester phosphodiesterase